MEQKKQIVSDIIDTTKKWNIFTIIFLFPIMIAMFIFASYYLPTFGKMFAYSNTSFAAPLSKFETLLQIPTQVLVLIFLVGWINYFRIYFISRNDRPKAYLENLLVLSILSGIVYYSFIFGLQYFVTIVFLRIVYWGIFVGSLVYILFLIVSSKNDANNLINAIQVNKLIKYIPFVYLVNLGLTFIGADIDGLVAKFFMSAIMLAPIFIIIFFTNWFRTTLHQYRIVTEIQKNQEYYRQEFDYSIEAWYGKKSKKYKESLKENV
ncbi:MULTISPECIES: hypothetical protein [Streptococcus]|uniref:Uncharacterized protein n=1 Tax=Streptococcus iners subsp. hyiners TaxID=3028083 RepID=A0AA96VVN9_9STRE|nr:MULTISPECIES: hypothetical protein [Streptococcus]MCK4030209.1 hypothetical protein [Streptococcus suis]WNY48915.1 hypothetical protein PW220_09355 [Streptococcus sp. 29892]